MGRRIFVGDLQGCLSAFERLLEKLDFDSGRDRLFLAGDLVNRGGRSLETLRLVYSLRDVTTVVLGNHDLHLLAWARSSGRKPHSEFEAIVSDAHGAGLLDWLRGCPLLWMDHEQRLAMVHAGIDPRWGPAKAQACAAEVEQALADEPVRFFEHMYGNHPDAWHEEQTGSERLRTLTNVFTRMRWSTAGGRLDLTARGGLDDAPAGFAPWFEHLNPAWQGWRIVFGHWSQLGVYRNDSVICLDSGCVWGGCLTALVMGGGTEKIVSVDCPPD